MTPAVLALEQAAVSHRVLEVASYEGPQRQQRLADSLGVPMQAIFKTLVAKLDNGSLVVAIVPIQAELQLKSLAAAAGAKKAVMAAAQEAQAATGYVLGGISPLGQRRRLATFADQSLAAHSLVYVSAGRRGLELELAPQDLIRLCGITLAGLARPS
nr:Cys-tRNA(Pro) deacylase [Oceanococcus sp. HetDA_MAG_MS8]